MRDILITALISVLTLIALTACREDADNLYGDGKEMEILDEYGDVTTKARASVVNGTTLTIIGGIGDLHIVAVEDEDILETEYESRCIIYDGPIKTKTDPAKVHIKPKKYGSTIVSITDTDIDKTIHIQVDVVDHYGALTVLESTAYGIETGMYLAFKYSEDNEYRFVSKAGKEYETLESGQYHFEQPVPGAGQVYLTLKSDDTETIWSITDADNNKDGHKLYLSDIYCGMGLPSSITTRLSYTEYYPTLFLFTDTSNPERTFTTGKADTAVKYTF